MPDTSAPAGDVVDLDVTGMTWGRAVLLTGNTAVTAGAVAAEVGIDDIIADVLPEARSTSSASTEPPCAPSGGNLFCAFAYNVGALPLAALGFAKPVLAGAAMAFSSLFAVGNSLRLHRFSPLPG